MSETDDLECESRLFPDAVEDQFCNACAGNGAIDNELFAACEICLIKVNISYGQNQIHIGTTNENVWTLGAKLPMVMRLPKTSVACDKCIERYGLEKGSYGR